MKFTWLLPLFLVSCARAPDPDAAFFLEQARDDSELRIEDAFKWLVHATRGGEHAVADGFAVRKWLENEWATLGPPQPGEPPWVPLTADGRIGRLNLRPYRAQGGEPLHPAPDQDELDARQHRRDLVPEQAHRGAPRVGGGELDQGAAVPGDGGGRHAGSAIFRHASPIRRGRCPPARVRL